MFVAVVGMVVAVVMVFALVVMVVMVEVVVVVVVVWNEWVCDGASHTWRRSGGPHWDLLQIPFPYVL